MAETLPVAMPAAALPDGFAPMAERALEFAARQVSALVRTKPDMFPIFTVDGRWQVEENAWTNWTEGFLGGQLWIVARRTGEYRSVTGCLADHCPDIEPKHPPCNDPVQGGRRLVCHVVCPGTNTRRTCALSLLYELAVVGDFQVQQH